MAFSMNPSFVIVVSTFMALSSVSFGSENNLPASVISAAPSLLPDIDSPLMSPALSPDITPLFPSPGGTVFSPSESTAPLIPSSPSPPNPDAVAALGPDAAFSPSGVLPDSSSDGVNVPDFLSLMVVGLGGILVNSGL